MATAGLVHLVVNPAAGDRKAGTFVHDHVEPLLRAAGYEIKLYETLEEKDAARIAREIGRSNLPASTTSREAEATHTVVLAGGDGTAHEFIEGIYSLEGGRAVRAKWDLIIIPLGTANALYASTYTPNSPAPEFPASLDSAITDDTGDVTSQLRSLAAFLNSSSSPSRLPISLLSFSTSETSPHTTSTPIPSHVVISTCLHSNLLATAETLRGEYPGVERFSVAAAQSAGKVYPAAVTLFPTAKGRLEVYDPASQAFIPSDLPSGASSTSGAVAMEDDFAYFLSSATCPRLEPSFVISPLIRRLPQEGSMDVTILRPSRDPRIQDILAAGGHASIRAAREAEDQQILDAVTAACSARSWEVLKKAYEEGAHVDLTYTADGEVESRGQGERVVEVYRCGGFEWKPTDPEYKTSHLVCADGSLAYIPPGGSASVRLDQLGKGIAGAGIFLWA